MVKSKIFGLAACILSLAALPAMAQDPDREALKRKILQEVEKKLQQEEARLLKEIEKVVEDEIEASFGESKQPAHGYLGVRTADLADDEKKVPGLEQGVRIAGVVDGAPAAQAGLKAGDIVVGLNGKKVGSAKDFSEQVQSMAPGTKVKLGIVREGKKEVLEAVLGAQPARGRKPGLGRGPAMPFGEEWALDENSYESIEEMLRQFGMDPEQLFERGKDGKFRPSESYRDMLKGLDLEKFFRMIPREEAEEPGKEPEPKPAGRVWLGIELEELSGELRAQLNLKDGKGILLAEVVDGSPAAKGGLKKNDVLVEVDDQVVHGEGEIVEFMKTAKAGQEVKLAVLRKAQEHVLTVTLGQR